MSAPFLEKARQGRRERGLVGHQVLFAQFFARFRGQARAPRIAELLDQFVQVGLPGIGECPISIASNDPKRLELNINRVGNVTAALKRVKQGRANLIVLK